MMLEEIKEKTYNWFCEFAHDIVECDNDIIESDKRNLKDDDIEFSIYRDDIIFLRFFVWRALNLGLKLDWRLIEPGFTWDDDIPEFIDDRSACAMLKHFYNAERKPTDALWSDKIYWEDFCKVFPIEDELARAFVETFEFQRGYLFHNIENISKSVVTDALYKIRHNSYDGFNYLMLRESGGWIGSFGMMGDYGDPYWTNVNNLIVNGGDDPIRLQLLQIVDKILKFTEVDYPVNLRMYQFYSMTLGPYMAWAEYRDFLRGRGESDTYNDPYRDDEPGWYDWLVRNISRMEARVDKSIEEISDYRQRHELMK